MRKMDLMRLAVLLLIGAVLAPGLAVAADEKPLAVVDSQRIAEEYEAARDAQEQYQKFPAIGARPSPGR